MTPYVRLAAALERAADRLYLKIEATKDPRQAERLRRRRQQILDAKAAIST
jgi:hypothetical protein